MRRWVSLFLLCLLPVQFVWAGVGAYVTHEADSPALHMDVGAHDHHDDHARVPHHDISSKQDHHSNPTAGCPCIDCTDCGHAHAHFVALSGTGANPALHNPSQSGWALSISHPPSPPLARPERPKWFGLA